MIQSLIKTLLNTNNHAWRTMEAPLRHNNCQNLTLEFADKSTNMFSRIQDTTYFSVFLQMIQGSNPAICFCYFNTKGRLHRPPNLLPNFRIGY